MKNDYLGVYDFKESNTFRPTEEKRIHLGMETAKTMTTRSDSCTVIERERACMNNLRIRKLTPTETMRLMAFEQKDTESLKDFSDAQIYHFSGDSIVVNCLIGIFGEMLEVDTKKAMEDYAERLANE